MTSASALSGLLDTSAAAGTSSTNKKDSAKDLNDRFLKLLVAQMNNQDPLNPLDNAQVTSQMAQISTVTGINSLTDTVSQLTTQFSRLEAMQAAQLTGRQVLVEGNALSLKDGKAIGGFEMSVPANVSIEVKDANGAVVRNITLGSQKEGIQRFSWDGTTNNGTQANAGNYTFTVKAVASGKEIDATPLAARTVEGVRQDGNTVQLVLAGSGSVAYSAVKQIL